MSTTRLPSTYGDILSDYYTSILAKNNKAPQKDRATYKEAAPFLKKPVLSRKEFLERVYFPVSSQCRLCWVGTN